MVPSPRAPSRHDGAMPTNRDLREVARVLRCITETTANLPDESPLDARLSDRLAWTPTLGPPPNTTELLLSRTPA